MQRVRIVVTPSIIVAILFLLISPIHAIAIAWGASHASVATNRTATVSPAIIDLLRTVSGGGTGTAEESASIPGSMSETATINIPDTTDTPEFSDVSPRDWFYEKVAALASGGIIGGFGDGTFRPTRPVSRAEMASFLVRAKGLVAGNRESFDDVHGFDWFYDDVVAVNEAGLMNGTAPRRFSPSQPLTREQASVITVRAAGLEAIAKVQEQNLWLQGFKDRNFISNWARPYVAAAVKYGLLSGYPNLEFRPFNAVSRAEAAMLIYNLLYSNISPRNGYPSHIAPYPREPQVTSPLANQVIYEDSFSLVAKVDPESTIQELWVNGKLDQVQHTDNVSTVMFDKIKASTQVFYIGIVSKTASGSAYSGTVTLYHFSSPSSYDRLIVVDKSEFKLYWIADGCVKKIYPIAIGTDGTPTPATHWIVGQKLYEDPKGVYGPRRLRLYVSTKDGYKYTAYGIHGTNEPWVIGTKASHGCIRLKNSEILDLWPQVNIGDHVITQE